MSGCLSNLDICKASCCKVVSFEVQCKLRHPLEDYYRKRGLEVKRINRDMIKVIIPHACEGLDDDNLCKYHESGTKPLLCQRMGEKSMKGYLLTEGCIYGKD